MSLVAGEVDASVGDRANGLACLRVVVEGAVATIAPAVVKAACDLARRAVEGRAEGHPVETTFGRRHFSRVIEKHAAPVTEDPLFAGRSTHSVAPDHMCDRVAVPNLGEGFVEVGGLIGVNGEDCRAEIDVDLRFSQGPRREDEAAGGEALGSPRTAIADPIMVASVVKEGGVDRVAQAQEACTQSALGRPLSAAALRAHERAEDEGIDVEVARVAGDPSGVAFGALGLKFAVADREEGVREAFAIECALRGGWLIRHDAWIPESETMNDAAVGDSNARVPGDLMGLTRRALDLDDRSLRQGREARRQDRDESRKR